MPFHPYIIVGFLAQANLFLPRKIICGGPRSEFAKQNENDSFSKRKDFGARNECASRFAFIS